MKILSTEEIRLWDEYTIRHEPIRSIDLMERAAEKCTDWLLGKYKDVSAYTIFCGKGNNGGDGLAIARLLMQKGFSVTVFILEFGHKGSNDFQINLARLHQLPKQDIHFIQSTENFHSFLHGQVIIDALFGLGLNRQLEGIAAQLVRHINHSGLPIISIDIPSGLFADRSSEESTTIKASHTLTFQCYKPAFLFSENEGAIGDVHILDIGLHPDYYHSLPCRFELTDDTIIHSIYKSRKKFSHKGNFGHALIIAGSYGKIGAAVLSCQSCLRSGVGLLTCHIPKCGYGILQTTVPEAMVTTDPHSLFITKVEDNLSKYGAIGIGPGIGTATETKIFIRELLNTCRKPLVLDADSLNIISEEKDLLHLVPQGSIITPHPKEFERLFGESAHEFERVLLATTKAKKLNIIIVLKGHHTLIATPQGKVFFNSTGNAGMATAGSGDVLTGILTGLLAQGYNSLEAAILGVYLHGMAGDIGAKEISMEAMTARDIIKNLGSAFQRIQFEEK